MKILKTPKTFEQSFASNPKSKYWSELNQLKPDKVFKSTATKFLFNCEKCNHEFSISLDCISNNKSWCPYCSNHRLCDEDCKICFEKSFASHPKSKFWSNKNQLKSHQVFKGTGKKYLFDCDKCNHEFEASLDNITCHDKWCSYCSSKKLCENEECKECFNKSFASHEKSIYWSDINNLNPRHIFKSSNNKYWFNCNKCNHDFETSLNNISWCPYCCIPGKKLCENENCKDCFEKSFSSHPKSKYWSDKNKLKPRQVFKSTNKKFLFNCDKCHNEFISMLYNVISNRWCPHCVFKTELKLFEWLKENYNTKKQIIFNWSKNKRYDFIIEELKLIIELDGPQHFRQVSNWESPEHNRINDNLKNKLANENNYKIIRICQEIVLFDKENWQTQLTQAINNDSNLTNIGSVYEN